ncbi:MAG: hypothetical protein LBH26_03150, partial [Treponema sp.]|nr:hypothetical protein [Treponema sp.]
MTKERQFRFSVLAGFLLAVSFLFGACLNPVSFDEEQLPRIRVEVEGTIKIDDVAVMWLINRTKSVDVTKLTVTRAKLTSEPGPYLKEYHGKPARASSLATYHAPLETPYTITVEWDDGGAPGSWTKEVQFPRPADYKFFLYRKAEGGVVIVDENEMKEVPDPNDTVPGGGNPSSENAQTFVVINVSPDQNVDEVVFVKDGDTFAISQEPGAKDQRMILLGAGSYQTTASYTKGGTPAQTATKNITVTREDGNMAVRTNFLYFYKTNKGDYQLSPVWPPNPNDASNENKPEDALLEGQGILRIINKATSNDNFSRIIRIKIDNTEHPDALNTTPYMIPGDVRDYILDAGTVHVSFMAQNQNIYGMVIPRDINSKQITTLEYTADLANPDVIPPDEGYGAGLIRITNNSQGVVYGVAVFNRGNSSNSLSYGYEDFVPARYINYNEVGRVPVIGTNEFPLADNTIQVIQVYLETAGGEGITVGRLAAIHGSIVQITITQDELDKGKREGSLVTVYNRTVTSSTIFITAIEVFNTDNESVSMVYSLPNIRPDESKDIYVLSGPYFPIMPDGLYKARLTVYGNGPNPVTVVKDFEGGNDLYSTNPAGHTRSVTLIDNDLPFIPISSIGLGSLALGTTTTTDTNATRIKTAGEISFNNVQL